MSALAEHLRKIIDAQEIEHDRLTTRMMEIEAAGGRLITADQIDDDEWQIKDYRTDEILAEGCGWDEYNARADELTAPGGGEVWDIDRIDDDVFENGRPTAYITSTPGIPESLAEALLGWVDDPSVADEDIAAVAGIPAGRIATARDTEQNEKIFGAAENS